MSLTHRNTAMTRTKANTIPAVCSDSLRVGHTTFFTSVIASRSERQELLPRRGEPCDRNARRGAGRDGGEPHYRGAVAEVIKPRHARSKQQRSQYQLDFVSHRSVSAPCEAYPEHC